MNYEGFTEASLPNLKIIGHLLNNWRQRDVWVYEHPSDPAKVVTIGYPLNNPKGETHICVEAKRDYERVINLYPETAHYN